MTKTAKYCIYGIVVCVFILIALYLYPISTKPTRIAFLITLIFVVVLLITLSIEKNRFILFLILALATIVVAKLSLHNKQSLNRIYADRLNDFIGVKYVWGGENRQGIDCSGLVRKAMIEALVIKGVSDFNFSHLKTAVDFWWNDCTARSLKNGFRSYTTPVTKVLSLNDADSLLLRQGDLAITFDGVHVLAYAGNNEWVEADPMVMEVIKKKIPTENVWFNLPMEIVRWKTLE